MADGGYLITLKCGHSFTARTDPPVGGWITCLDGHCQGQRKIVAVVAVADG